MNHLGIVSADSLIGSTVSSNPAIALHSDLARGVGLWPLLPLAIRAAILTLANTNAPSAPPASTAEEQLEKLPPGYENRADR